MIRQMIACLLSAVCLANTVCAEDRAIVIRDFKAHISASNTYSEYQKQEAMARLNASTVEGASSTEVIADILEKLDADFATSMAGYRRGDVDNAIAKLKTLLDSADPYVARESRFYLANCYVMQEDHESALPLLHPDHFSATLHAADALFLLGICQTNLLQRNEALGTFSEFLRAYPNASERQRNVALMYFEKLSLFEAGTLVDIYQKMEFSRRRLARAKANEPTQTQQKEALAILDKLIKVAEEREASSESESKKENENKKSESQSKGKGAGKEGPGEGNDDKSPTQTVRQVQQGAERSSWDFQRDKKRDAEALAAIKDKYPARYRALIEQYYRSLQDETER